MFEGGAKVIVRTEQNKIVSDAKLNQHCVNSSDLDAVPPAGVPDFCRVNVVLSIWLQEGEGGESVNQLTSCLWSCKALKQLL
jgi:hypothetical protein